MSQSVVSLWNLRNLHKKSVKQRREITALNSRHVVAAFNWMLSIGRLGCSVSATDCNDERSETETQVEI